MKTRGFCPHLALNLKGYVFMENIYKVRRQKIRQKMHEHGLDYFLVQSPANRYYLSGFELFDPQCNESSGYLVISRDKTILMTDPRYVEAGKQYFSVEDIFVYSRKKYEQINFFLKEKGISRLGFEPQWMNYEFYHSLKKEFELVPVKGLVEDLRFIKDNSEIELLRKSCRLNHKVFKLMENIIEPGLTEMELAWEAEKLFRENGASGLSFSTIVASGCRSALPHAIPQNIAITNKAPLLIDMGCRLEDYCSDQTRTFWVGDKPSDVYKKNKELVVAAQEKAINKITPGMPIKDAYGLVQSFFEKHGVADHFTHALGHGIGLETHEPPSVGPNSQGEFKPGMVISVEPGLYYPQWGGVRWEYMVLVTENGAEIL